MAGEFEQIAQKMAWASKQLTALGDEITEYVNRRPYVSFIHDKPELQGYEVTFRLHEPPPAKIALLAGDFLNNAQGALDYLAWQLVSRDNGVPGSQTYFPILPPNDDGSLPLAQIVNEKRKPAITDAAVLDTLDAVQPYKEGPNARSHPLFLLKRLNRESKHRELPLLIVNVPAFSISGGFTELPEKIPVPPSRAKGLKDKDEVQFIPYSGANPGAPEKIEITVAVALEGFEEPVPPFLWDTLVAIHNRLVEDVLPRFQPFF